MSSIDRFFKDLRSAVAMGQLMEIGDCNTPVLRQLLTLRRIDDFASRTTQTQTGRSDLPPRLIVAQQFAGQSGAVGIVFDALSVRPDMKRWNDRVLRRTWAYLWLLFVTMATGLAMFYYFVNPVVYDLRADLKLESAARVVPPGDFGWLVFAAMVGGLVLALVVAICLVFRLPAKIVTWLGGRTIARQRQASIALSAIEVLSRSGMPMQQSVQWSCDLVAADPFTCQQIDAALSRSAGGVKISVWAQANAQAAQDRMAKIDLWLPLAATAVIGGVLAFTYCLLIYQPLISLLKELASVARGL